MSTSSPRALPLIVLTGDVGHDGVRTSLRNGQLLRVRRGAYTSPLTGLPPWQQRETLALARCVALDRQLTCRFAFSHVSAALLHGCQVWDPGEQSDIIQRGRPSTIRTPGVRRHTTALGPADVTVVNGLRVTTLERTVLDCARSLHPRDALVIADSAARLLIRPDRRRRAESTAQTTVLRSRLLERLAQERGGRGVRRARAVITALDPLAESAGETVLRWIAISRGLPTPVTQPPVATHRGTYYTDLAWRLTKAGTGHDTVAERFVHVEFDGWTKYRSPGNSGDVHVLVREKLREDAIRRRGDTLLRFVWADLHRPAEVFSAYRRALPTMGSALRPIAGLLTAADVM